MSRNTFIGREDQNAKLLPTWLFERYEQELVDEAIRD
jgi:hypothetical protein